MSINEKYLNRMTLAATSVYEAIGYLIDPFTPEERAGIMDTVLSLAIMETNDPAGYANMSANKLKNTDWDEMKKARDASSQQLKKQ